MYYNFIELIILSNTFSVISFAQYKEYIVWKFSSSTFSNVFPAFTCTSAIDNLWNICLTPFSEIFHFDIPWKRQKTFSGGIEIEHGAKMG